MNEQNKRDISSMQIEISGKSMHVENVLERTPTDFSIKGCTAIAPVYNAKNQMRFDSNGGRYTIDDNSRIIYKARKGDSGLNSHFLYRNPWDQLGTDGKLFTLVLKVNYANTAKVKLGRWNFGHGVHNIPLEEKGIIYHTFKTGTHTEAHFLFTNLLTSITETEELMFDMEVIGIFEGELAFDKRMNTGTICVSDIYIDTQEDAPILGEYTIQGDVPDKLNYLEDVIEEYIDVFDIDWI